MSNEEPYKALLCYNFVHSVLPDVAAILREFGHFFAVFCPQLLMVFSSQVTL